MAFYIFFFIIFLIVVSYCLLFYQRKLVFYPQPPSQIKDEIHLQMQDGTKINGWIVDNKINNKKSKLLIYFGGNKEEVSSILEDMRKLSGWAVVLLNYRGYGSSEGTPSEKNLYNDSIEIYDYFSKLSDIYDTTEIVVMGRSLGSGVATYVALHRNVSGVILVAPYDRIANVAKYKFPLLSLLIELIFKLRYRFDSVSRAHMIKTPLLTLATPDDRSIPFYLTEALVKKWGGPSKLVIIQGQTHRSLSNTSLYWNSIIEFLDSLN